MRTSVRQCVSIVAVLFGLVLVPAVARAQSSGTIAGVVKDTSGAVMPGVTVEAASPALIEKVRAVVTDESGQYKIVDLRPGVYSVTFILPGFKTIKRDEIGLTTGFTATVNAELAVGTVEETITVTGSSPIVDTQNVRTQTVLSRDLLDTLPTGKTFAGYAALIPGVTASLPGDVGGSKGEANNLLSIHNSRTGDMKLFVDGLSYNYLSTGGGSARGFGINQLAMQEVVIQTGNGSAETETGGVQQNAIPKDGGNTFQFSALSNYTGPSLNADNLTDTLRARGLTSTNSVRKIYDYGAGFGGPLRRDTLWFYTAHRWWGAQEYVAGNYYNKSPNPLFYVPDLSRQAYGSTPSKDSSVRLTWQATQKQKFTVYESYQRQCYCHYAIDFQPISPEGSSDLHFEPTNLLQGIWTYPATNRFLLQVGATYGHNPYIIEPTQGVSLDSIPITELSTGYRYGAHLGVSSSADYGETTRPNLFLQATGSYVTGSHAFKTGFALHAGVPHSVKATSYMNPSNLSYSLRNAVPASVTQWVAPWADEQTSRNIAVYAQDQWTLRQLTLNLGVRFDALHAWVPAQTFPAGRFIQSFSFAKVDNVPNWKDISPRLGAAYDLFGNGRTAIRAALGRYVVGHAADLARVLSPAAALALSTTRVWNDANGDFVPQESELGPSSNSAFGTSVRTTNYSNDYLIGWGVRDYSWQGTVNLQQELRPGVGLMVGYFRTWYGNFTVTDNLLTTPADFSPFCVTAPVDARLPGGGGNQLCGLADITPTAFGRVNNLVTPTAAFGKQSEVFDGLDVNLNIRFGQGGLLNAGTSLGRTLLDRCYEVDSPQQLYQCRTSTANNQFKINGAYPLPWDLQISATYQNLQGPQILANLVYTNAQIAPSVGRNLGQCGTRVPCNGTATVSLIEPGTQFEDRYNQLDLRLTKTVRLGRTQLRGMADAYNVFNASSITGINTTYGPRWRLPLTVQLGRLFKFGAQLDW